MHFYTKRRSKLNSTQQQHSWGTFQWKGAKQTVWNKNTLRLLKAQSAPRLSITFLYQVHIFKVFIFVQSNKDFGSQLRKQIGCQVCIFIWMETCTIGILINTACKLYSNIKIKVQVFFTSGFPFTVRLNPEKGQRLNNIHKVWL